MDEIDWLSEIEKANKKLIEQEIENLPPWAKHLMRKGITLSLPLFFRLSGYTEKQNDR